MTVNIKVLLSTIVREIKEDKGYSYNGMVKILGGMVNKTQLTRILVHKGDGVSCELIHEIIIKLGYRLEVSVYNKEDNEYL